MTATLTYALRPVTEADSGILRRIYASTRSDELAPLPWTAAQKEAFLEMQFQAQHADYHHNYPDADFTIIHCEGTCAGRLYVHRFETGIHVIDLALLPEFRGHGIGTSVLTDLINEADSAGKPLSIHVEKHNRALSLYQKLGFIPKADAGIYFLLEISPQDTRPSS